MKNRELNFIAIDKQGTKHYGGNQRWWKDVNPSLKMYGCGVIAMCNMELCLKRQLQGKENHMLDKKEYEVVANSKIIPILNYIDYVNQKYETSYRLPARYPFNTLGLMPCTMRRGIEKFYKGFGLEVKAKWAPTFNKTKIVDLIEDMLERDIPIPASYYVFNKKNKLVFYNLDETNNKMKESSGCTSHYFNITGLMELDTENDKQPYLKISSWGEIYYIKLEDWIKKLSYFTNILYVGKY